MQTIVTRVGDTRVGITAIKAGTLSNTGAFAWALEPIIAATGATDWTLPIRLGGSGAPDFDEILTDASNTFINSIFPTADAANAVAPF